MLQAPCSLAGVLPRSGGGSGGLAALAPAKPILTRGQRASHSPSEHPAASTIASSPSGGPRRGLRGFHRLLERQLRRQRAVGLAPTGPPENARPRAAAASRRALPCPRSRDHEVHARRVERHAPDRLRAHASAGASIIVSVERIPFGTHVQRDRRGAAVPRRAFQSPTGDDATCTRGRSAAGRGQQAQRGAAAQARTRQALAPTSRPPSRSSPRRRDGSRIAFLPRGVDAERAAHASPRAARLDVRGDRVAGAVEGVKMPTAAGRRRPRAARPCSRRRSASRARSLAMEQVLDRRGRRPPPAPRACRPTRDGAPSRARRTRADR